MTQKHRLIMLGIALFGIEQAPACDSLHTEPARKEVKGHPEKMASDTSSETALELAKKGISYLLERVAACYKASIKLRQTIAAEDQHSTNPASIIDTNQVANHEQPIRDIRKAGAQQALQNFLGQNISSDTLPTIGFCFSGGGIRAMLETVGWLSGAEQLGIVSCAQYASGLSGSTWALNPWVASGMTLDAYKNQLIDRLTKTHTTYVKAIDMRKAGIALLRKAYSGQSIGVIDLYSMFLAALLLDGLPGIENPYEFTLSSLVSQMHTGDYPLIISTAILGGKAEDTRTTFEFSPFTSGSFDMNAFVPTWALGRGYHAGTPLKPSLPDLFTPERFAIQKALEKVISPETAQSLAQIITSLLEAVYDEQPPNDYYGIEPSLANLMGICGSAFSLGTYDIILNLYDQLKPLTNELFPREPDTVEGAILLLRKILSDIIAYGATHISQEVAALAEKLAKNHEDIKKLQDILAHWGHHPKDIKEYIEFENFGAASMSNITYALEGKLLNSAPTISLVDGGFQTLELKELNIGIMPLLQRKMDVIIICDSSEDLTGAPSLQAAALLAQKLNLPFPQIPDHLYNGIEQNHATLIIDDNNLNAPIIVYMPSLANKTCTSASTLDPATADFTGTLNFTYTPEQSSALMNLISCNVIQSKDILKEAFRKSLARKNAQNNHHRALLHETNE